VGCRSNGIDFLYGAPISVRYESQVKITISSNHFVSNYAANGGAISVLPFRIGDKHWESKPSQVTIKNSTFFNNSAKCGGAIFVKVSNQSTLILENVIMKSNRVSESGGAAWIGSIFAFKILHSRLLRNSAGEGGGAFFVIDVNRLEIKDSLFDGNIVRISGGALYIIYFFSTLILITNTTFKNCSAEYDGGAVYLAPEGNYAVSLAIRRSRFVENLSLQASGGALSIQLTQDNDKNPGCVHQKVKSVSPRNHYDHDDKFASLVYKNLLIFEDSTFEKNAGVFGGAVYLLNGKATFINCSLPIILLHLKVAIYTL